jgi:hypothetical protein
MQLPAWCMGLGFRGISPGNVLQGRDVQPSDAAGAAGGGAVLAALRTELLRQVAVDLRRVRPLAHPRRVRLHLMEWYTHEHQAAATTSAHAVIT